MKREKRKLEPIDLKQMNVPEEYWYARFDKIQPKSKPSIGNYLNSIEEAMDEGAGLLLMGAAGVGKSCIAVVVAKEARARGYTGYFTTLWQLRDNIRDGIEFNDSQSVLDRCKTVSLLILDNLRTEDAEEKYYLSLRSIEELLAHRRARRLTTLLTTRLDPGTFRKAMPGMADATQGLMVMGVEGENLRLKKTEDFAAKFLMGKK